MQEIHLCGAVVEVTAAWHPGLNGSISREKLNRSMSYAAPSHFWNYGIGESLPTLYGNAHCSDIDTRNSQCLSFARNSYKGN